MTRRQGWRFTGRKRVTLLHVGALRVWLNLGAGQLRGRMPSVSVQLGALTWNSYRSDLHFDGPGPLNFRRQVGRATVRQGRDAGRRHEWARVTLGVMLTLLLAGGVALWTWVAEVMAR